ncbi:hypothetical protein D3C83_185490 [compost metagenome]
MHDSCNLFVEFFPELQMSGVLEVLRLYPRYHFNGRLLFGSAVSGCLDRVLLCRRLRRG